MIKQLLFAALFVSLTLANHSADELSDGGEVECTAWMLLNETDIECPEYADIVSYWGGVDCVTSMAVGEVCEGDGVLPDGQYSSNANNCGEYDMYVCSADSDGNVLWVGPLCTEWVPIGDAGVDCPEYYDVRYTWSDVDCVEEMNLGDMCEGDGDLPSGEYTGATDNCSIYDMYVCSADSDGNTLFVPCADVSDEASCDARDDCQTKYKKNGNFKKCKDEKCKKIPTEAACDRRDDCMSKYRKNGDFRTCKNA